MAAVNCSVDAEHVQQALAKRRALGIDLMRERIQRGIDEAELPADADDAGLANFYATVYQALDGAGAQSFEARVDIAMRAWPARLRKKAAGEKRPSLNGPHGGLPAPTTVSSS
jgi:hypothetical protein